MVEHAAENRRVSSSILDLGIIHKRIVAQCSGKIKNKQFV